MSTVPNAQASIRIVDTVANPNRNEIVFGTRTEHHANQTWFGETLTDAGKELSANKNIRKNARRKQNDEHIDKNEMEYQFFPQAIDDTVALLYS
jgi:hypothetical protein